MRLKTWLIAAAGAAVIAFTLPAQAAPAGAGALGGQIAAVSEAASPVEKVNDRCYWYRGAWRCPRYRDYYYGYAPNYDYPRYRYYDYGPRYYYNNYYYDDYRYRYRRW